MKTIKELNSQGITIVLITHYMEEAAQAQRVIVMDDGRIIMDDVPKKIFSRVNELKACALDVPQVTELMYELENYGFSVDHTELDEEKCADALAKLILGR